MQGYKDTRIQEYKDKWILGYKYTKIQDYRLISEYNLIR